MLAYDFPQMTDAQLAGAYQCSGDNRYFGELYSRYYDNVFAYCCRFIHDREGAMDVSQESFLRAAEGIGQLRKVEFFGGWLFRIVRNECIDYLKARASSRKAGKLFESLGTESDTPFSPSPAKEREQKLDAMQQALAGMDEGSRRLLKQKYLEGLPITELQARYGLTESAVKMRLARARKRVQASMAGINAAIRQQVA